MICNTQVYTALQIEDVLTNSMSLMQVVQQLLESMHLFGLSCLFQGLSEVLLLNAYLHLRKATHVLAGVFDLADVTAIAVCLIQASSKFDQVVSASSGQDLRAVVDGLGSSTGLSELFQQLYKITLLITVAQSLEMGLPVLAYFLFGSSISASWHNVLWVLVDLLHVV